MVKRLALALMLAGTAIAQAPNTITETFQWIPVVPIADAPKNAHEYSMSKIKEYQDYKKSKYSSVSNISYDSSFLTTYSFIFGDTRQSFSIDWDGKVALEGITIEDALLATYIEKLEDRLNREKDWDHIEKMHEEAINDHPPAKVVYRGNPYEIQDIPDWSKGKALGDTNCGIKRIRIRRDMPEKKETIFHELMHVASGCKDNFEIHSLIMQISPGLLKILQDNPNIVNYLTNRGKYIKKPTKMVAAHWILDPLQTKQPGNENVKPCTPQSTTTCYEPSMPHITNHIYGVKEHCETGEHVKCTDWREGDQQRWVPIGKPVFEETTQ